MDILLARKKTLAQPLPSKIPPLKPQDTKPQHDPFQFESYGQLVHPYIPITSKEENLKEKMIKQPAITETKPTNNSVNNHDKKKNSVSNGKVQKDAPKRPRRFVTNWTEAMDKIIKKSLVKFGWGCWSKIAASGKLPKEYNSKIIANRAKSMGLTKDMFKNPLIPKDFQTKPKPKRKDNDKQPSTPMMKDT